MALLLVPILLAVLSLAGAAAAIVKASAPLATTGRGAELSILAGLLVLTALFWALVAYWLWRGPSFAF